jgi:RHS repeat-associated protein
MTRRLIVSLLLLSSLAAFSQAQLSVATGTPQFGSFGGGLFDSINLGNLNVHFSIPVVHKAGRGLPFTYDLAYDSSVWYPVTVSGSTTWQMVPNNGWTVQTQVATGYVTYSSTSGSAPCNPPTYPFPVPYTIYSNWQYHDPFGITHPFGAIQNSTGSMGCPGLWFLPPTTGSETAYDGSGYTLSVNQGSSATVTGKNGSVISPPINTTTGAGTVTDANGNQISVNSSGVFTDTLGTTALTVSGSPASGMVYKYTSPSGSLVPVTVNYTLYNIKTKFNCSGIADPTINGVYLVTKVVLPDTSFYSFAYEANGTYTTGRLQSVTLPTGGSITYTYGATNDGVSCTDGSTVSLTRTLNPGGTWAYSRSGSGNAWTTTVIDPKTPGNQTVINYEKDSAASNPTTNFYETQRKIYQGAATGTPLSTTITCYNGQNVATPSSCPTTPVATQILRVTSFRYLPDSTGVVAETDSTYDQFGLIREVDEYDYGTVPTSGSAVVGPLLRKTITSYAALGNGIVDRPSSVVVEDSGNNLKAGTTYTYDDPGTLTTTSGIPQHVSVTGSRGNLTSVGATASGTTTLYRKFTYYDTGTLNTSTDVSTSSTTNGVTTTYVYASGTPSCNSAFPTSITEPLSLSRSMTWNCTGAVLTGLTDENNKPSSTSYTDPYFWRPASTTDQAGNITTYTYSPDVNTSLPTQTESKLSFNGNNSVVDVLTAVDGFGRTMLTQRKQGPSATNYDTTETDYDIAGCGVSRTTLPYSGTQGQTSSSAPGTSATYDGGCRTSSVTDGGGASTTYTYAYNDTYETRGPAPSGENTKRKQLEYGGLGWLKSVCEITAGTSLAPSGTCSQSSHQTGYWTTYAYDTLGNQTGVTQNAQATSNQQTRTFLYDMLGRLTSETNPETNKTAATYSYDSLSGDTTCGTLTSAGNMLKTLDPAGNGACYVYDSLHRVTSVTYPSTSTPQKNFVYDAATVNSVSMVNAKTRLAEAYTSGVMPFQNTDFEGSSTIPPAGWTGIAATLSYDATTQYAGLRSLKTAATGIYGGAYSPYQPGFPGKTYTISGYIKSDGTCQAYIQIRFLDSTGTYLDSAQTAVSTQTSWHFVTATNVAPANTVYTQLGLPNGNATGAGICEFDNISASGPITDEGFSYSALGQVTDVHEKTPNSAAFYHVTSQYWPSGSLNTLSGVPGLPTITYGASDGSGMDGEGRVTKVNAASGQNPVTAVTYNVASQATAVTLGSVDNDVFTFDPNTGRMTQYQFNMGSPVKSDTGVLTWNPNAGLKQLAITDQIYTGGTHTCNYTHDDLGRIATANCGTPWNQTFSYDAVGNITKTATAGISFTPGYDITTNRINSSPFTYDISNGTTNNGNLKTDNNHTYAWDTAGKMTSVDFGTTNGVCLTYDALGRMVEQARGSSCNGYTQIVYAPSGGKLALMNAQTLSKAFVSLPSGGQAVYTGGGLAYYRHPDWLRSSRLATTPSRTMYYDTAYAPYGENYLGSGTMDLSFTAQNQDTVGGGISGNLYDFLYRQHTPVQGRWLSPDPAGMSAVNPANPQTWNRYAYVANNPLRLIDPAGLDLAACDSFSDGCGDGGGGGYCPPEFESCDPGCDPYLGCDPGGGGGGGPIFGGGGGAPLPAPRRGGVWPGNETLGLPKGLNLHPATLADLLGLSPGTQCDLGGCNPIGNGLTEGVVLGAGGTIVCQIAEPCGAIEDTALLILLLTTAIVLEKTTTFQPCIPPAGTQCYEMHKGHEHNGWDPHYRIWTRNQVPSIGKCFWNEGHGTRGTTELPPAGMQECSTYSTWPNN